MRCLFGIAVAVATLTLSGCSYVKSWFPDKEKDYQFHAEIPELIVPADLLAVGMPAVKNPLLPVNQLPVEMPVKRAVSVTESTRPAATASAVPPKETATPVVAVEAPIVVPPNTEPQSEPSLIPAEIAKTDGIEKLRIAEPLIRAWRMIGKALSRHSIEILERNPGNGYFYVKYEPEPAKVEDKSLLDELNFVVGDDPNQAQELRINLTEMAPQMTEAQVADVEGKPLTDKQASNLLTLIKDTINQSLAK